MNNTNPSSRIISFINNLYFQRGTNRQSNNENVAEVTTTDPLSRVSLQTTWQRLQTLSNRQRNQILGSISGSTIENNEMQLMRRVLRRRTSNENQNDQTDSAKKEELEIDYIDYRSYPLKIDWSELISKGPACKSILMLDNISKFYGLFGVAVNYSISSVMKVDERNIVPSLLEYFCTLYENRVTDPEKLESFVPRLPDLEIIQQIILKRIYSDIELVLIKTVLDIYEFYYRSSDHPLFETHTKCIGICYEFYCQLNDEQYKYLYEKISSNKYTLEILKNKFGCTVSKVKSRYLKRLKLLKLELTKLSKGMKMSMFTN